MACAVLGFSKKDSDELNALGNASADTQQLLKNIAITVPVDKLPLSGISEVDSGCIDNDEDDHVNNFLLQRMNPPKTPDSDDDSESDDNIDDDDIKDSIGFNIISHQTQSSSDEHGQFDKSNRESTRKEMDEWADSLMEKIANGHRKLIQYINTRKDILLGEVQSMNGKILQTDFVFDESELIKTIEQKYKLQDRKVNGKNQDFRKNACAFNDDAKESCADDLIYPNTSAHRLHSRGRAHFDSWRIDDHFGHDNRRKYERKRRNDHSPNKGRRNKRDYYAKGFRKLNRDYYAKEHEIDGYARDYAETFAFEHPFDQMRDNNQNGFQLSEAKSVHGNNGSVNMEHDERLLSPKKISPKKLALSPKKRWKRCDQQSPPPSMSPIPAAAPNSNQEEEEDIRPRGKTHHIFVRDTEDLDYSTIQRQYRDIVVICQFNSNYISNNGLQLEANRTILKRKSNQTHGYAILSGKSVSNDKHCWRIRCEHYKPWIFIGVCRPGSRYSDASWSNKGVWGISTCSQSNKDGDWSTDYRISSAAEWKTQTVLHLDMMIDCNAGTLTYREISEIKVITDPITVWLDGLEKNGEYVPHFNLHTIGSVVTVRKIPSSRFGQIW